jgi:hypothetical protein
VTLDSRRVLHLLLGVGTFKTGVRREPPTFSYGVVLEGGAPTRWLKSLSEATTVGKSSDERPPQPTDAQKLSLHRR